MKEIHFKGIPYRGEAAYINGYNGYYSTTNDGLLCAIINNSCWTNNVPNLLKDGSFNSIIDKSKRGLIIIV